MARTDFVQEPARRTEVTAETDVLVAGGRYVASDYLACNTLRLIVPCLAAGQAARLGVEPRAVPPDELRCALACQGVWLGDAAGAGAAGTKEGRPAVTVTDE